MSQDFLELIQNKEVGEELKAIVLQDHFQRQAEARAEAKTTKNPIMINGPFLAATASVIAAFLSGLFAYGSVLNQSASEKSLEELRFDFELIRTALSEHKLPEERLKSLQFFKQVGLLNDLPIDDIDADNIPFIATDITDVFTVENLYPETAATLGLILSEPKVSSNGKAWKKFWHLYRVDLIGVESREVARAMVAFGRTLTALSKDQSKPSDELKNLAVAVIDAMAIEVPKVAAFKEKLLGD